MYGFTLKMDAPDGYVLFEVTQAQAQQAFEDKREGLLGDREPTGLDNAAIRSAVIEEAVSGAADLLDWPENWDAEMRVNESYPELRGGPGYYVARVMGEFAALPGDVRAGAREVIRG